MFCENCGTQYFGNPAFCEKCGHKLTDAEFSFDTNNEEQRKQEATPNTDEVKSIVDEVKSITEEVKSLTEELKSVEEETMPTEERVKSVEDDTMPKEEEIKQADETSQIEEVNAAEGISAPKQEETVVTQPVYQEPTPQAVQSATANTLPQETLDMNNQQAQSNNVKPKKGILGVVTFLFLELIVLGAMIYFLVPFIFGNFSAEHKAKEYFVALVNEDYDSVYSLFNINTKDDKNFLLKKDGLKQYRASLGLTDVLNYKVNDDNKSFWKFENSDDIRKEVVISYTNRGDSNEHYFTVNLVKESAKKYYIFDEWSIDYVGIASSNVIINVLEGAKVKIDDIEIPEKYSSKGQLIGGTTYTIPMIFAGKHKIEVSLGGMETLKLTETIKGNNDTLFFDDMRLSKETAEELQELAITNMKSVYLAALNGEPFDKVKDIFVQDEDSLSSIKTAYEELAKGFNNDSRHVSKIEFTSVNTEIDADKPIVTKSVAYHIYFSYYYRPWFGDPEWRDSNNTGSMFIRTEFKYVDGKWLQTDLGCDKPSIFAF